MADPMKSPGVQRLRRRPEFDLAILEGLAAWRKAMMDAKRLEDGARNSPLQSQRAGFTSARDRAYKILAEARETFEKLLRADAHAAVE